MIAARKSQLIVIVLAAVAVALRSFHLTTGPINLDEGYTLLAARNGVLAPFLNGPCDWNPPAASLPHAIWLSLFGSGRFAAESLSVVSGIVTLVLSFFVAEKLFGNSTAVKFLFLASLSQYHLLFSQFIRVYSAALSVTTCAALLLVDHWRAPRRWKAVMFVFVSFAAINLHHYAALAVFSMLAGFFFVRSGNPGIRRFTFCAGALLGLAFLPTVLWHSHVIERIHRQSWIEPVDIETLASIWYHFASESPVLLVVYWSLSAFAVRHGIRRAALRVQTTALLSWLFFPMVIAAVFSLTGGSILHVRYFIFCLLPFLMLAACGWELLPNPLLRAGIGCIIGVASAFSIGSYFQEAAARERDAELDRKVGAEYRSGDIVVHTTKCSFVSSVEAHQYLLPEYVLKGGSSWVLSCTRGMPPEQDLLALANLERIWLVDSDCFPRRASRKTLSIPGFAAAGRYSFSNGEVTLFEKASGDARQLTPGERLIAE